MHENFRRSFAAGIRSLGAVIAAVTIGLMLPVVATAAPKAPAEVHFALSGVFPSPLTVDDITVGMGAFKEVERQFGIKVVVTPMAAGPTAMSALLGGSIDFVVTSGNAFLRAASIGQPIVAIMQMSRGSGGALSAPKKLAARGSGLTALKKWNGGRWGVASPGGIAEYHARRAAEDAGLVWKAQDVIYTGSLDGTAAGIISGRLDIGETDYWTTATLLAKGAAYVVINPPVDLTSDKGDINQLDWILVARKETIEKYPALTQAIVRAELKGLLKSQELRNDPAAALAIYPPSSSGALEPATFANYWALNGPTLDGVTGIITPAALDATAQVLRRMNVLKSGQGIPANAYDNSFVRAAYRDLKRPEPSE